MFPIDKALKEKQKAILLLHFYAAKSLTKQWLIELTGADHCL
jgi:hypothetical protein